MKFLSVCSGIEAASVAWNPLGWKCHAVAEIEKFPCAVLKHHYPDVPNYGDITRYHEWPAAPVDVLIGGTPCQSFSVAGIRKGLDDPRGNLSLVFVGIVERFAPRWFVWENVPGVLSIDGGRAFGSFLGALGKIGYGFAYRILDAQYFGLAQRRKRVFVVGHSGGQWQRAAAVLFDTESVRGDSAPSRTPGQGTAYELAPCIGASGRGFERSGDTRGQDCLIPDVVANDGVCHQAKGGDPTTDNYVVTPIQEVSKRQSGTPENGVGYGKEGDLMFTLQSSNQHAIAYRASGNCGVMEQGDKTAAINTATDPNQNIVAFHQNASGEVRESETGFTVSTNGNASGRNTAMANTMQGVRRLTPRECERLQGFPDDYTLIPGRTADGPRYKALGNSMAVPVIRWIGRRIEMVEAMTPQISGQTELI